MLPDNYETALRRSRRTEKRFLKEPEESLRKEDPKTEKKPIESCYLPRLSVRPDKATTEASIVCDASAKCEGISLSDVIHQGPKLKREIFSILILFHKQAIALVCCIAEMYLHISLTPEDSWHDGLSWGVLDQSKVLDEYEFK